jgi:mannose-6-phosphate isomerase-like protein (cupin superfamily)
MNTPNMEVGIINLKKDQKDTQQPHESDEIYYVISGIGKIVIDGGEQDVNPGKNNLYSKKYSSLFSNNY